MAIFHLSIKTVSRAHGRSAVGAAAYRAGQRLIDVRQGRTFDYRRKAGVLHRELIVPAHAPLWAHGRESLWNAAEKSETRKNSTVAREFEVALPSELSGLQRRELALGLARELSAKHSCAVDVAVHAPGKGGDSRNEHAHILTTTRRLTQTGFAEKCRELDNQKSGEVAYWRERWAQLLNEALESAAASARVDHRSLAEQGIEREPTEHLGPVRTGIARRLARRAHVTDAPQQLTPQQERLAKQLTTMRARLSKTNLSRFESQKSIQNAQGGKNEITPDHS